VDVLEPEIDGLQGFGTLLVVPGGESRMQSFHYALPGSVLVMEGKRLTYHLKVEKQPGTLAAPLILRLRLPQGASLESPIPGAILEGNDFYLETNLQTDLDLQVHFLLP
jgi:hypothetical protein